MKIGEVVPIMECSVQWVRESVCGSTDELRGVDGVGGRGM